MEIQSLAYHQSFVDLFSPTYFMMNGFTHPRGGDVPNATPAQHNTQHQSPFVGSSAPIPSQVHGIGISTADISIANQDFEFDQNGINMSALTGVSRMASLLRFGSELSSSLFDVAISTILKYGDAFGGFTDNERQLIFSAPKVLGENYDEQVRKLKEIEYQVIQSTISQSGPDHVLDLQTLQQRVREALANNQDYSELQAQIWKIRVARSQAKVILSYNSEHNQAMPPDASEMPTELKNKQAPRNASETPAYQQERSESNHGEDHPSQQNQTQSPQNNTFKLVQTQAQNVSPTAPVPLPGRLIDRMSPPSPIFPGHHPRTPIIPLLSSPFPVVNELVGRWFRGEFTDSSSLSLGLSDDRTPSLSSPVSVHFSDAVEEHVESSSSSADKRVRRESSPIRILSDVSSPLTDDPIASTLNMLKKKESSASCGSKRKSTASASNADGENPSKILKIQ